jgi:malonyl-CoA/methylmalonyl-CoA synthetase
MEVIRAARRFPSRVAVTAAQHSFTYGELLEHAAQLGARLTTALLGAPPAAESTEPPAKPAPAIEAPLRAGARVGVMAAPGAEYVASMWGAWLSGSIAVPLALSHPSSELSYVLRDAGVSVILATEEFAALLAPLAAECGAQLLCVPSLAPGASASAAVAAGEEPLDSAGALIIYTSGTTGRPKGALHTHGSLASQVGSLVTAWEWAPTDRILHPLPLHHIHGIVNALLCPHTVGAAVEFLPRFSPTGLWSRLRAQPPATVFMGVPTMYVRLLQAHDAAAPGAEKEASAAAAAALRLTVSGSAACPVPLMRAWEAVTGTVLLERYGMTEVGMALSNPYRGERRAGYVGVPLPGVRVKVVPEHAGESDEAAPASGEAPEEGPGELRLAGPMLFAGYWGRREATAESFDEDGFFRTGDTVVRERGAWRILGRTSVDIIKCGGYKLSALEIETHLLEHPAVGEAAVVGLPDEAYGQVVAAVLVGKGGAAPPTLAELRVWARDVLAPYKVPTQVKALAEIPRNAMGKVNKKELAKVFL